LEANTRSRELEEIRKRDHDELVEIMTRALHEQNPLKMVLATSTPEVAHSIVEVIEQVRPSMPSRCSSAGLRHI